MRRSKTTFDFLYSYPRSFLDNFLEFFEIYGMKREFKSEMIPSPRDLNFDRDVLNNYPLDLEIGAGVGLHPIQYTQNEPERHLIALERTKEKFGKFQSRYKNHDLSNLTIIHDDIIPWLNHYGRKELFDRIFILYPNPEARNKAQRWVYMPFMRVLLTNLKNTGTLELRTNLRDYYDEAKRFFVEDWGLRIVQDEEFFKPKNETTHFEKKYLERGESCFQLILKKS